MRGRRLRLLDYNSTILRTGWLLTPSMPVSNSTRPARPPQPSSWRFTHHAIRRMGQRGFHDDGLGLIQLIGTEVKDGYIVLNRDRQAAEHVLKRLLDRIRRLDGKRVVAVRTMADKGLDVSDPATRLDMARRLIWALHRLESTGLVRKMGAGAAAGGCGRTSRRMDAGLRGLSIHPPGPGPDL